MAGGNSEQVLLDVFLQKIRQKDEEIEAMREQKRDDDAALRIAHERIAQLKKEIAIKTKPWPRGEHNNDESSNSFADKVKSTVDAATGKAFKGKQLVMPITRSSLSSERLHVPRRKRRKHWYDSWYKIETKIVYSNDEVMEMELPCFDSKFDHIGIARPVENPDDQHRSCYHCLQSYTEKDFYDHLGVCRAFWNLAVRCGHCGRIFKLNDAFYGLHAPECKVESQDTEFSGYHYTLASAGV